MDLLTIIITILACGLAYYLYNKKNIFEELGVPHDPPQLLLGNMAPCFFRKISFPELIQKLHNKHSEARYFGFFDFQLPMIIVRDPEIIKSIAVKNFDNFPDHRTIADVKLDPIFGKGLFLLKGEEWKETRNLLTPFFTSSKMKMMFNLMMECAMNFTDALHEKCNNKRYTINLKDVFTRLTSDVISSCSFGIKVDSMKDPENELYIVSRNSTSFDGFFSLKLLLIRHFNVIARFLGVSMMSESDTRFFTDVISSNIAIRKEKGITRQDFLQLMMEAQKKQNQNEKLSIEEITATAVSFIFGGLETVSTAMSFSAHEIALNPEVQKRIQEEIDAVLEATKGQPTYNEINKMSYLEAVIYEALRKHPSVAFTSRECKTKFELPPPIPGKNPVIINPGMVILFPAFSFHRDPKYYENPEKFDPERFLGDNKVNTNSATYLPFGIGPRTCVGNRFSLLEIKVTLFHLLARCNLKTCSKTPMPIKFKKGSLVLLPEGGFWLDIEARK